jgi:hypothetical protein
MVAVLATSTSGDDRSVGPQIDERIDVGGERVGFGRDVEDVMKRYVRVQRPHEEKSGSARLKGPDFSGSHGSSKIVADERQPPLWRAVGSIGVKGDDQVLLGAAMHVNGDILSHRTLGERHEVLGDGAQNLARIGRGGIDVRELQDKRRRSRDARLHGRPEEGLLRFEVAQHRRGRHAHDGGDVRERGGVKAFLSEDLAGRLKQFIPGDARWPAHL